MNDVSTTPEEQASRRGTIGLLMGLGLFIILLLTPPPEGLTLAAWRVSAVGLLMATWWITEPIPIPATSLLPLALFPLLAVTDIESAAAPYANSVIFLFLGGFLIAQAMQRWELHRRIALMVIAAVGTEPVRLVGGVMLATGFLSLWVSNSATAVMMLPIGLSIIDRALPQTNGRRLEPGESNFAVCLMLGIAYASTVGGLGSLIGTPPNALLAAYMAEVHGVEIGFGRWMLLGMPLVAIGLPLTWVVLTRVVLPVRIDSVPGGEELIRLELRKLGPWTVGEKRVCAVFVAAAVCWIFRPVLEAVVPGISDPGIAIIAALLLFLLPVDRARGVHVLHWTDAQRVPFDVLILFGGGLSLAAAIGDTGLAQWIGDQLSGLSVLPILLLTLVVALVVIFLTELTSNTATAAAFLPVVGSLAIGLGHDPLILAVPAALAASTGFMMPVGTPPNAIVYASGYVTMQQMMKAGVYLNALFAVLVTLLCYGLIGMVFGT